MSLVLNVELLGEYRKLTEATNGAKKQLGGLQSTAETISSKINGAFAAIGVGLSFYAIVDGLKQASKAAIQDNKSQKILAGTMKNTIKATDKQVASVEDVIKQYMLATSVADDELRPAYSKLLVATGDISEANELLGIALDTASGTGKSLDSVVMAMTKSIGGNEGALARLVPAVKGAKDPMKELEDTFKGASTAAANEDPYLRMQVLFGEIQEQIGQALMPKLQEFSDWLASPGGQERIQEIADIIIKIVEKGGELVDWILKYKEQIEPFAGAVGILAVNANAVVGAIKLFNIALSNPYLLGAALVIGGIAAAMGLVYENTKKANDEFDELERKSAIKDVINNNAAPAAEQVNAAVYKGILNTPSSAVKTQVPIAKLPSKETKAGQTVVNNVVINNTKQTPAQIVKDISKLGTTVGKSYIQ